MSGIQRVPAEVAGYFGEIGKSARTATFVERLEEFADACPAGVGAGRLCV